MIIKFNKFRKKYQIYLILIHMKKFKKFTSNFDNGQIKIYQNFYLV